MLPAEGEGLTAPEPRNDLEPLVEDGGADASIRYLAEMRVAGIALVTDSHAEHEPALGELVDGGGLARDVPRPAPRERNHFDAQGHAARAHGHGGENGPRIAGRPSGVALVADVVL